MNILNRTALAAALMLVSLPASAQNARTWVSGAGVDQAGCGPIATPCRTLQYAHDQTNAGGEVNFKDSAGYGFVTITKAISIIAEGVFAGVLAGAHQNAITINAGPNDSVVLRGLSIEGAGVGVYGILYNTGAALTVANCLIEKFGGRNGTGILMQHTAGSPTISINDVVASNNEHVGIWFYPTGSGGGTLAINHATTNNEGYGIDINMISTTGKVVASIANSSIANNLSSGVETDGDASQIKLKLETSTLTGNQTGFSNTGTTYLGRTTIVGSGGFGVYSTGTLYSYGNNEVNGNGIDRSGSVTNVPFL